MKSGTRGVMFRAVAASVVMVAMTFCGCIHRAVPRNDLDRDMNVHFKGSSRIPARVGLYLSDDLKRYTCWHYQMGFAFEIRAGERIAPITNRMVSAMFQEVLPVSSLPPYLGSPAPDVTAVVEPELLHFSVHPSGGFTESGTLDGTVEARTGIRLKIHDLDGNLLWQEDAEGNSLKERVNLVEMFLSGKMEKMDEAACLALASAAQSMIGKFQSEARLRLDSLVDGEGDGNVRSPNAFSRTFAAGLAQFEKKNYQQALHNFLRASNLNSLDPYTRFYTGVCYAYTGRKKEALREFNEALRHGGSKKLDKDCRNWIKTLGEPLKIGVIFSGEPEEAPAAGAMSAFLQALKESQMYSVIQVNGQSLKGNADSPPDRQKLQDTLRLSLQQGAKILIFVKSDNRCERMAPPGAGEGDIASEYSLRINARVYSTRKRTLHSELTLTDSTLHPSGSCYRDSAQVLQELYKRSANRLVLKLLESNVM